MGAKVNKQMQTLGIVKLKDDLFDEVMAPLLDIFEYKHVLVSDDHNVYTFDEHALEACPEASYKQIIVKNFKASGGDLVGFSNLVGGPDEEKLGSPFRTEKPVPSLGAGGGTWTSAHTGRGRTPKRNLGNKTQGNNDELRHRARMICWLAHGKTREQARTDICEFEAMSSTRSRVLTRKSTSSAATQSNSLDDIISSARNEVKKIFEKNKETIKKFPECAFTKMINVIALGWCHQVSLYENTDTASPSAVTIIEFIKQTDGADRREYKRLAGGREWPYLTDADINEILLMYAKHFPVTITASVDVDLREALRV